MALGDPVPSGQVEAASEPVVRLVRASGVKWQKDTTPLILGEGVSGGSVEIVSGRMELLFSSGARVGVKGPAKLELAEAKSLFLEGGQVSVLADGMIDGFVVETPSSRLVDLGTEFGVRVADGGVLRRW